jgi:hypothetical protein
MPLHVGWHLVIRVFLLAITRERCLKPPNLDLIGGGISPCLILWEAACPGWLSPMNGDPGSTEILTRHCGAKSLTVNQLANSGTTPTRQVPVVRPLRVIETPADEVIVQVATPFDNPDGTVRLH